jgi:hypothetical protein
VKAVVAWRTGQSGAPATSPGRWVLTVGASDSWATGQSGGAPDRSCSLSGPPSGAALTSARAGAHCRALTARCRRPLALSSRYSAGAPDSPMNYSRAAPRIPEGGKFGLGSLVHRTLSGAPDQGTLRLSFALCI